MITPVSYEVIPFLSRFASMVAKVSGLTQAARLATVLAGSALINFFAMLFFFFLSKLPVSGGMDKLLPPAMQAGLFAAIGWGLYSLSWETLGIDLADVPALTEWGSAKLWLPAHAAGLLLWVLTRVSSHPLLFPGFLIGLIVLTHTVRIGTGTSIEKSREDGWLMAATIGRPCYTLWESARLDLVHWEVLFSREALCELFSAALFGPLINVALNIVLLPPVIKGPTLDPTRELRAHAAGSLAASIGIGYSNYLAVSNTAIHVKCGGSSRLSCYMGAGVAFLFFVVHPLFAAVGYVPTLVVAAICIYIGFDFLYDALIPQTLDIKSLTSLSVSWGVFSVCLSIGMLWGVFASCAIFSIYKVLR